MSYFNSQKEDPWSSSLGSSAPAYSFGEQPAAPQPTFAAPQPTFAAPQPTFAAPQPTQAFPTFQNAPVAQASAPVFAAQYQNNGKEELMEFTTVQKLLFFCSYILFFTVPFVLGALGYLERNPNQSYGNRIGEYSIATSFVDGGALDSLKLGICDGNFKYTISSSGIIESENYPAPYSRKSSCTNQFDSAADGITFEFQSFLTEEESDFIVFRDSEGNDFGGKACSGDLKGTLFSVDSSRLPVSIHFKSDDKKQESGFSIAISAGYDPENDLKNGPCASKT